jgi:hypothetical protein
VKKTGNMPLLVYLGLWGISSRAAAFSFFWVCVVLAVASVAYGFVDNRAFGGVVLFLAPAWYWYHPVLPRQDSWLSLL